MLDELVGVTGWLRANALRQTCATAARPGPPRAPRPRTYGYDTLGVLIRVWVFAGRLAGKYLAATMPLSSPKL